MARWHNNLYENVIAVISEERSQRQRDDVDQLLPWFRRQTDLFKRLSADSLREIITNCEFRRYKENDVIIKQGDKGHSFFIILSGSTSIYVSSDEDDHYWGSPTNHDDDNDDDDDTDDDDDDRDGNNEKNNDDERKQFGIHVGTLGSGSSFGELALIDQSCLRTATIIADQLSDMIVIHRDLYSRMLKAAQKKDIEEKINFIQKHPLFRKWKSRHRSALALGLRKTNIGIGQYLTRYKTSCKGIFFILSGYFLETTAGATMQSDYHLPCVTRQYQANKEGCCDKCLHCANKKKRCLRTKQLDIGLLGPKDIIGDLEMICNLRLNVHSTLCIEPALVYTVNKKTFHKLLVRRYPDTYEIMQRSVMMLLRHRLYRIGPAKLYQYPALLQKIQGLRQQEKEEEEIAPELNAWLTHRGPIIDDHGPGSLFYRIQHKYKQLMHMKAIREIARSAEEIGDGSKMASEKLKDGNAEYSGLVKNEILAQMFQKALTLRAELASEEEHLENRSVRESRVEDQVSEDVLIRRRSIANVSSCVHGMNEVVAVDLESARKFGRTTSFDSKTESPVRGQSSSLPSVSTSDIKRTNSHHRNRRQIRSAPTTSSSSVVYRQFNQETKRTTPKRYSATDYKYLKEKLRHKEKNHSVNNNLWL